MRDAPLTRNASLDTVKGYFTEVLTTKFVEITFETFAHSTRLQLLITIITARRLSGTGYLNIPLKETSRNDTDDFSVIKDEPYDGHNEFKAMRTKEAETDSSLRTVYVYNSAVSDYKSITVASESNVTRITFVMSIDTNETVARAAYDAAVEDERRDPGRLLREHIGGWGRLWGLGYMSVDNSELQSVIDSSLYYIMSSVRFNPDQTRDAPDAFYGISSDSLSRGALGQDRQGHIYREAEQWIYPALLVFHPSVAESMLHHRYLNRRVAAYIATTEGKQGYRFPSDSAFSGNDLSSSTASKSRIQINADVAFATRQFFAASWNAAWLNATGCDLAKGLAEYWNSRIEAGTERYDINQVAYPSDDSRTVDNSAYVNAAASSALKFATLALCLCKRFSDVDDEWTTKANELDLPFDTANQYHLEHEGFVAAPSMKELGVVMLGFPLMYNMSAQVRSNDLDRYARLVDSSGPSTVYSVLSIGYNEVGNDSSAKEYFEKSYKAYTSGPFKVWNELNSQNGGAVNHLPGAGAFLQALLYGYAGVRIRYNRLELNPKLPPGCRQFKLLHVNYLDAVIDITVQADGVDIRFPSTGGKIFTIEDSKGDTKVITEHGQRVQLSSGKITIQSDANRFGNCSIPTDKIEGKQTPQRSAAASRSSDFVRTATRLLFTLLLILSTTS